MNDLKQFAAFVEVAKDPDKFAAKIAALEERNAEYQRLVSNVTKAKDIDKALKSAQSKEEKAQQVLDQAKAEAQTIMDRANVQFDGLKEREKEVAEQKLHYEAMMASGEAALAERAKQVEQRETEAQKAMDKAAKLKSEADAIRRDYQSRMNDIRKVANG